MVFRGICFFLLFSTFTSCQFFTQQKNDPSVLTDTLDITKVDASPFFEVCKDKIDEERTRCFRTTMHQKISEALAQHAFEVQDTIDEKVTVKLMISAQGKITVAKVTMSSKVRQELPELDSLIHVAVAQLPQIYAATKKGMRVTTQYELPIQIQLD